MAIFMWPLLFVFGLGFHLYCAMKVRRAQIKGLMSTPRLEEYGQLTLILFVVIHCACGVFVGYLYRDRGTPSIWSRDKPDRALVNTTRVYDEGAVSLFATKNTCCADAMSAAQPPHTHLRARRLHHGVAAEVLLEQLVQRCTRKLCAKKTCSSNADRRALWREDAGGALLDQTNHVSCWHSVEKCSSDDSAAGCTPHLVNEISHLRHTSSDNELVHDHVPASLPPPRSRARYRQQ